MSIAAAPSLLARLMQRRTRATRQLEPADMGTAFGMEQWLDERDQGDAAARTQPVQAAWLPRWLRSARPR